MAQVVGRRVRTFRKAHGWSQERLAQEVALRGERITKETIRRIEDGSDAKLSTLSKIADALGVQVADLLAKKAS